MTKRKTKLPAKPPQSVVTIVDSRDHIKIAKGMASNVDGWADMSEAVQQEIIALNVLAMSMKNGPVMTVEGQTVGMNAKNPQLHTMRLMRTFASSSGDFINYLIGKLATALKASNGLTAESLNGALAFVDGVNPKTEVEAMLAVQMFATNDAALRAMRTLNGAEWADTAHQFGNLTVKLMRTFTMQAEALAKLQRGGVQTVKHIHIDNRGGQAVVADTVHSGGQNARIENQPYEPSAALPCQNAAGVVVPMSGYTGSEALPDSRRG